MTVPVCKEKGCINYDYCVKNNIGCCSEICLANNTISAKKLMENYKANIRR